MMLVFLFHAYGISKNSGSGDHSVPLSFVVAGNTGVTLFFVLSGFLLCRPWLLSTVDASRPQPKLKNYYQARALRILPLYWLAVLFAMFVSGEWAAGVKALSFGFVGFDIFPYSVVWWTLTTEVQFYLLMPLVFLVWFSGRLGRVILLATLLLWLFLYIKLVLFAGDEVVRNYWLTKSLFGRLPAFLVGGLVSWLYIQLGSLRTASPLAQAASWLFSFGLVITLGFVLRGVANTGDAIAEATWHLHHSYEAALWGVLLLITLLGTMPLRRLYINRFMASVGKLSYSMYLNHVPLLFLLIYPFKQAMGEGEYADSLWLYLLPVAVFMLSLGASYITYRLIELPFLEMKHRLSV